VSICTPNRGAENAGVENAGVDRTNGKCRNGKYRSDNVWKAVKQKMKINSQHFKLKVGRLGVYWCQAQQLTGLVPGVGVLHFEADSESDSDSGQEPGLWGTPPPHPTPECMDSRFEQFVQFALIALYSVRKIRTSPTK